MITQSEVNYSEEINENLSADDIRDIYSDDLLIWIWGSGSGNGRPSGTYYCVLDYRGNTRYMENEIYGASANAVMIDGFREAVGMIKKPMNILLLTPCPLGFNAAFHGKGPNAGRLQDALQAVTEKKCTLKTSVITGDLIKQFVAEKSGKTYAPKENKYKKMIYRECLGKVCGLLQDLGIDRSIIDRVREVNPEEE